MATKFAWRYALDLLEAFIEVELVSETEAGRDSLVRHVGTLQHQARGINPFHRSITRRRQPHLLLEAPPQAVVGHAHLLRDLG